MNYPRVKLIPSKVEEEIPGINEGSLVDLTLSRGLINLSYEDIVCTAIVEIRNGGEFKNKAVFLPRNYDYRIVRDDEDALCLLVIKKHP